MPLKLVPFESLGAFSYSPSIVTMALSCISSEIKPNIGRKSWFFHTSLTFDAPIRGPRRNIVWYGKLEWFRFNTECNGRTDRRTDRQTARQTSCHGIVRAMYTRRAVKMVSVIFAVLEVSFWALTTAVKLQWKVLTLIFAVLLPFLPRDAYT